MLDLGATVCRPGARRATAARSPPAAPGAGGGRPRPTRRSARPASPAGSRRSRARDRQGRGRLVDALRGRRRSTRADLAAVMGWPDDPDRARRVAATLVADGLGRSRSTAPTASA